jgi:hypothetical protein
MTTEQRFTVRYQYGTYSGTRVVWAEDSERAIAAVKRELRPHMTLPMAHESYTVEGDR